MLSVEPLALHLKTPFRIAHGTSTTRRNALVRCGDALGEAALPPYYPHTFEDVERYVRHVEESGALDKTNPLHLEDALERLPPGPAPAQAALDIALHDRWGRALDQPLYRLWGLDPEQAPVSSVTIALPDDLETYPERVRTHQHAPFLKLKLGTGSPDDDLRLVATARTETEARLGVDANGAWSIAEAAQLIPRLRAHELAYVEQPLPQDVAPNAWHRLRSKLPADAPPLLADESTQTSSDVLSLADAVDGINVKLAKAGGLHGARRLIALARALDLQILIGCMIESSVALTAAAHLAPLADFADLDSHLLIDNDPFTGVTFNQGQLHLPDRPGVGVQLASKHTD